MVYQYKSDSPVRVPVPVQARQVRCYGHKLTDLPDTIASNHSYTFAIIHRIPSEQPAQMLQNFQTLVPRWGLNPQHPASQVVFVLITFMAPMGFLY